MVVTVSFLPPSPSVPFMLFDDISFNSMRKILAFILPFIVFNSISAFISSGMYSSLDPLVVVISASCPLSFEIETSTLPFVVFTRLIVVVPVMNISPFVEVTFASPLVPESLCVPWEIVSETIEVWQLQRAH